MQFIGTENDINNQDSVGALVRYYYFNLEVKKAVADIKLITTNQNGNSWLYLGRIFNKVL